MTVTEAISSTIMTFPSMQQLGQCSALADANPISARLSLICVLHLYSQETPALYIALDCIAQNETRSHCVLSQKQQQQNN